MRLLDYIFLLRPMLIVPVWTIALLGARASLWATRGTSPFEFDHYPFTPFVGNDLKLLLMLGLAALLSGGAFIINQIFDIESDRKNKKLFLLAEGHLSLREAWVLYAVTTLVAIGGTFLLNWQLGVLFICGALLGIQYSHPRFKVRTDAYKSIRNNVLAHGMLAFLFGWVLYQNFNIEGVLKSVPYMLGVGALYLNTTLPDIKGDKRSGKATYGIFWGVEKTQTVSVVMVTVAIILSTMAVDYGFALAAAISLPFFIAAKINGSVNQSTLATKVAILALSLFAVLYFPPYLAILLVTIIATRAYYATRFAMTYPAMREESK